MLIRIDPTSTVPLGDQVTAQATAGHAVLAEQGRGLVEQARRSGVGEPELLGLIRGAFGTS